MAWQAFCELREVLQLTNAELPNGEDRPRQTVPPALEVRRIERIEMATKAYQKELRARLANANTTTASPAGVILKYFKAYGARLFGHPTRRDADGRILAVVERTNNIPEHFFGREKHKLGVFAQRLEKVHSSSVA
jgi:CRISPR/Cas system-associated protein Cas7 (RAMP superfamily)